MTSTAQRRQIHIITPGDHFSPSTGSATVSVVHGLSSARPPGSPKPAVVVARGTYPDRYDSAEALEYQLRATRRSDRYVDAVQARLGATRSRARARYRAALEDQASWAPAFVICHNAVQTVPVIDVDRHVPVLYAHNDLLRTYTKREASESLANVAVIIAVSGYLAGLLEEALPARLRSRVEVVANGVDVSAFEGAGRDAGEQLQVAFLGRVVPEKGADVLLDALALLGRGDIKATLIGSEGFDPRASPSAYEQALRRKADQSASPVAFLPFQPRAEVARLLRGIDVLVVPSRWPEPFALTVLEGMAAGAAVIASDVGGIPEACGGAGLLVPPGDPAALAEALAGLADDRGKLRRLQEASRIRARRRDWGVAARELSAILGRHA